MARSPRTIITDFRHLTHVTSDEVAAGRSLPGFLASIVGAASMEDANSRVKLPLRCRCRPGHRACPGNIIVSRHTGYSEVEWRCSECEFNGVISHWKGSAWDFGAPPRAEGEGKGKATAASPARIRTALPGRWRIVEMEVWDIDAIELMGPAIIEFDERGGSLRFIAVEGDLDCRYGEVDGRPSVEFSWMGADEGDVACGRGWAHLQADGSLAGRIFIHDGDDSSFTAKRLGNPEATGPSRRRRMH